MAQVTATQQFLAMVIRIFVSPDGTVTTIGAYYGSIVTVIFFILFIFDFTPACLRKMFDFIGKVLSTDEDQIRHYHGWVFFWVILQALGMLMLELLASLMFPMILTLIVPLTISYVIHQFFYVNVVLYFRKRYEGGGE